MKKEFKSKETQENKRVNETNDNPKTFAPTVPKHIIALAAIVKYNSEIKRFTAIGILNYLAQTNEIVRDPKDYVKFKWDKFSVKNKGLVREYKYTEPFFLTALVASFSSFSASAQKIIDEFCKEELNFGIQKAVNQEEVDNMAKDTEEYTQKHSENV